MNDNSCVFSQDDIIDDVGDFVAAAEILKERGAYKIYIMATHGLLSADAPRLIEESAIDEVSMSPRPVFSDRLLLLHPHMSKEDEVKVFLFDHNNTEDFPLVEGFSFELMRVLLNAEQGRALCIQKYFRKLLVSSFTSFFLCMI